MVLNFLPSSNILRKNLVCATTAISNMVGIIIQGAMQNDVLNVVDNLFHVVVLIHTEGDMGNGEVLGGKPESLVKSPGEIDAEVRMKNCLIDILNCQINPVVEISGARGMTCGFNIVPLKNGIVG